MFPSKKTLHAVKIADGSLLWGKKGVKLKGQVKEIKLNPAGIIVKGHGRSSGKKVYDEPYIKPFINALSYETGKSLWRKPFKKALQCQRHDGRRRSYSGSHSRWVFHR